MTGPEDTCQLDLQAWMGYSGILSGEVHIHTMFHLLQAAVFMGQSQDKDKNGMYS